MSFTNLLTIAIPCFERKKFILEALESALNQTVKCTVIVVDNCSSHDYFEKICKEKGVTYFRNEKNIGLFPNINRCYTLAQTEYVKVLDDDDLLSPHYVESFLNALAQYPNIDVFYTDYLVLSSKGLSCHKDILPFGYMENGDKIREYGAKYSLGFPYMTSTIKKSIAQLDLDKNLCVGGYDWVWVYSNPDKLSFYGESGKLHQYRMHCNKSSRGKDWSVNLLTHSFVLETFLSNKLFDKRLKKKLNRNIFWVLIHVKSQGNQNVLNEIMNSDNRFGNYLKIKLNDNYILKMIYKLPQSTVNIAYITRKILKKYKLKLRNK